MRQEYDSCLIGFFYFVEDYLQNIEGDLSPVTKITDGKSS